MEPVPSIPGAPAAELLRSPAAARVGRLAAASGLLLAHTEHRVALPWPDEWIPDDRPDLGDVPTWEAGVLPETKYRGVELETRMGEFHPAHRAKWAAHELCHGLVGFAWKPGASLLWLATAARLGELLPVTLWYFLDEGGLRRCRDHQGGGPLYATYCAACEAIAARGAREDDPHLERWMKAGQTFVERELSAVARTVKSGRPVPNRHATLELSSDGLAYVGAHGRRMRSEVFARYVATFCGGRDQGYHDSFDSIEARILELLSALKGEGKARPLVGDRWRWVAQDLGWRMLTVLADCEGEAHRGLDQLIDALAADPTAAGVAATREGYRALHEDWVLPDPDDLFAVGTPLPGGGGRSVRQVTEGVRSALPQTWSVLGLDQAREAAAAFTPVDPLQRAPIGRRFARYLAAKGPEDAADLARLEAAITHAGPPDAAELTLGVDQPAAGTLRLAAGVELVVVRHDPARLLEDPTAPLMLLDEPQTLLIRRTAEGERLVLRLLAATGAALAAGPVEPGAIDPDERDELVSLGALVPVSWAC